VKRLSILLLLLSIISILGGPAAALAAPYESYNYSWYGDPEPSPVPYLPERQITGTALSVGSFSGPEDMFVTPDGKIYLLDSGNNRIIRMNEDWKVTQIIDKFMNNGAEDTFSVPQGMFVHRDGHLYIADTGNKRIVELEEDGSLVRIIPPPVSDVLPQGFVYQPIKLVVDSAGRIYVVGKGVFDGIMSFDSGGKFTGFMGLNEVQFSPIDLFWKRLMTEEQRSKMILFIPTEFNNVDIDEEGFIFATTGEAFSRSPVKRLNPSGTDVLKRNGYQPPMGDIRWTFDGAMPGSSTIVSVAVDRNGIYSILDNKRGRVFTYDREGKFMYVFGVAGEQQGTFKTPVDIEILGNKILVLDKGMNRFTVFSPTRYGETIRNAVIYTDTGEEDKAIALWEDALKMNNNLEIAYLGMGKAELRQGNNLQAMESFRLGMHREYYSRAFERYRKEFMWEHFNKIALGALAAAVLAFAAAKVIKVRREEPGVVGMAWHNMFHPFNGFWELKYENKGKMWFSLLILLLLSVLYVLKRQFTGFIFNPDAGSTDVSLFAEMLYIALPFFLWCVANWSLTTLMDGEGKFKEIVVATAYALVPLVLVQIPLILLSNVITVQEAEFYNLLESIAYIWVAFLLFVGMLTVHQYSVSKTIATMLLTLVVIAIILFLALLFFSLAQQMLNFGTTIYNELLFRMAEG